MSTDHLEQAAAKALEHANDRPHDVVHDFLYYVAGLIRGAAVRPIETGDDRPANMTETQLRTALVRAERDRDHLAAELRDTNTHLEHLTAGDHRQRWHQAAAQRDALVRAAREMLKHREVRRIVRRPFLALLDQVEHDVLPLHTPTFEKAYALRRELWAVLGREAGTDEDLVQRIGDLARAGQACGPHPIEIDGLRRDRDDLVRAGRQFLDRSGSYVTRELGELAEVVERVERGTAGR